MTPSTVTLPTQAAYTLHTYTKFPLAARRTPHTVWHYPECQLRPTRSRVLAPTYLHDGPIIAMRRYVGAGEPDTRFYHHYLDTTRVEMHLLCFLTEFGIIILTTRMQVLKHDTNVKYYSGTSL